VRPILLSLLPSLGTFAGALIDQRHHLGFTNWRAACRSTGFSPRSILEFTFELLPTAIVGMLLGALLVVIWGMALRCRVGAPQASFAAHLGCLAAMPLMLPLCALALPPAVTLVTDAALGALAAMLALHLMSRRQRAPATHP
jgi:hypothetical protein